MPYNLSNLNNLDKLAVEKFQEYLKIPTVHPDIDYEPCIKFLEDYAQDLNLPIKVYRDIPNKPVAVFQWVGKELNLPAVLLNGHMDVVPVFEDKWTHKPFAAEIDDNGNIYARGTQDMKCISIMYLEAIRRLKMNGFMPKRTIFVFFVPDEEMGGLGMERFVKSKEFQGMNIGFALDEGDPSPNGRYIVYNGEKTPWEFTIHCSGSTGHGSLLLKNTAAEKVRYLMDKFSDYRRIEEKKLEEDCSLNEWDITSVNLTQLSGGVQVNVIPEILSLSYDIRISPSTDIKEFEQTITSWCKEAGDGIWIEYHCKETQKPITSLQNNLYWVAIEKVANKMQVELDIKVCVGATDVRFLRELKIPALGISPIRYTTPLAHDNDELLSITNFLEGLRFYYELIPELTNV